MESTCSEHLRPIDQAVLDLLRQNSSLTVHELTGLLEVTATAVRQRLERLAQGELIERTKNNAGRGRPQFSYSITPLGLRFASAGYADLASALWQEVMSLPNPRQRRRLLGRVAVRMGESFRDLVPVNAPLADKFSAIAAAMGRRKVPAAVSGDCALPILEVHACPYPELTAGDDSRQLCELEQEMLSSAIGQEVELDCCRLDGHTCCQFKPVA